MKIHNYNNDKGIAIFVTLMLLFLLSLIAAAALLTAYNYSVICEGQIKRQKALASAEAGVHYVCYQLRTNETYFVSAYKRVPPDTTTAYTFPAPVMNGITSLKVWVEDLDPPVPGKYIIKSEATYPKAEAP